MSQQPVQYQQVPATKSTNTMALVGFILSFFFSFIGSILALIGLIQISNSGGREGGKGLAIAGIIIGIIPVLVIVVLMLLGPMIGDVFSNINNSLY